MSAQPRNAQHAGKAMSVDTAGQTGGLSGILRSFRETRIHLFHNPEANHRFAFLSGTTSLQIEAE